VRSGQRRADVNPSNRTAPVPSIQHLFTEPTLPNAGADHGGKFRVRKVCELLVCGLDVTKRIIR